jgi:hypothetical protein
MVADHQGSKPEGGITLARRASRPIRRVRLFDAPGLLHQTFDRAGNGHAEAGVVGHDRGLVPAIHAFADARKTWMRGTAAKFTQSAQA